MLRKCSGGRRETRTEIALVAGQVPNAVGGADNALHGQHYERLFPHYAAAQLDVSVPVGALKMAPDCSVDFRGAIVQAGRVVCVEERLHGGKEAGDVAIVVGEYEFEFGVREPWG
jgi:hypothetical protein